MTRQTAHGAQGKAGRRLRHVEGVQRGRELLLGGGGGWVGALSHAVTTATDAHTGRIRSRAAVACSSCAGEAHRGS